MGIEWRMRWFATWYRTKLMLLGGVGKYRRPEFREEIYGSSGYLTLFGIFWLQFRKVAQFAMWEDHQQNAWMVPKLGDIPPKGPVFSHEKDGTWWKNMGLLVARTIIWVVIHQPLAQYEPSLSTDLVWLECSSTRKMCHHQLINCMVFYTGQLGGVTRQYLPLSSWMCQWHSMTTLGLPPAGWATLQQNCYCHGKW